MGPNNGPRVRYVRDQGPSGDMGYFLPTPDANTALGQMTPRVRRCSLLNIHAYRHTQPTLSWVSHAKLLNIFSTNEKHAAIRIRTYRRRNIPLPLIPWRSSIAAAAPRGYRRSTIPQLPTSNRASSSTPRKMFSFAQQSRHKALLVCLHDFT